MVLKADCCTMIIIFLCLMKIVYIRAQCETPNLGGNRVVSEGNPPYLNGSTVKFSCSIGYQPVNSLDSKTITCIGTNWTELALECKKKSCGSLPDIFFGSYTYSPKGDDGILYGATATAKCDEGYKLVGNAQRECRDTGWDGRDPVCEAIKCAPPPSFIENGGTTEPLEEVYRYQQVVTYFCNTDYHMFGNASISCLKNGSFPSPPQCKKVSCEAPIIANATRVQGIPPYKYKSIIQFECEKGFTMVGEGYLLCDEMGWNPPPPTCTALTTRAPTKDPTTRAPTKDPTTRAPTNDTTTRASTKITTPRTLARSTAEGEREAGSATTPNKGAMVGSISGGLFGVLSLWTILLLIPSFSVLLLS